LTLAQSISDLSAADRRILAELQDDGRLSNNELAERVAMSASPCWRRTRALEEDGVIRGYRAELDPRKLGWGVLVFVLVQIDAHGEDDASAFERGVAELDEVIACHSLGGAADFLLQVVARDLDSYAEFAMTVLRRLPRIKAMTSNFALKEIKPFRGLPVR
jgi:DNA-binding Lrp family transcriptional regulator